MLFQDFNYGMQGSWFHIVMFVLSPEDKRITYCRKVLPIRHDLVYFDPAIFSNNKEIIESIYHRHESHNMCRAKLIQDTQYMNELIPYGRNEKSMSDNVLVTDLLKQSMFTGKPFVMAKEGY